MTNMKAIIFGSTGAVGTSLAEILSKDHPDWQIFAVTRSTTSTTSRLSDMKLPNVTMIEGHVFDKQQVLDLCKDKDLIYCCVGFQQYETKYWAKHWPLTVENLLNAVVSSSSSDNTTTEKKQRLIFCDNLYAYGPGTNISSTKSRITPSLKSKPGIRAILHERFIQHMKEYPGTLTVVGASDFFGPHITTNGYLCDTVAGKIVLEDSNPLCFGSPNTVHDFCYVPDFARALAITSIEYTKAYDKFWIAPHSIHNKSYQDIGNQIAKIAGLTEPVKFLSFGSCMVSILSLFMSMMSELKEMLPFWISDYTVDDTNFINEFGIKATPMNDALQSMVEFYQEKKRIQQQKQ